MLTPWLTMPSSEACIPLMASRKGPIMRGDGNTRLMLRGYCMTKLKMVAGFGGCHTAESGSGNIPYLRSCLAVN